MSKKSATFYRRGFWIVLLLLLFMTIGFLIAIQNKSINSVIERNTNTITETVFLPPGAAFIPSEMVNNKTLSKLSIGDFGWTVPWAMTMSTNGKGYLNGNYAFEYVSLGTSNMKVEHTAYGYVVYVPRGYTYQPQGDISLYGTTVDFIPVFKIEKGENPY